MAKTPGLLGRQNGNFEPKDPYVPEQGQAAVENNEVAATVTPSQPTTEEKSTDGTEQRVEKTEPKKKFKNQQGSIKISNQSKEELEALMKLTNTKFMINEALWHIYCTHTHYIVVVTLNLKCVFSFCA